MQNVKLNVSRDTMDMIYIALPLIIMICSNNNTNNNKLEIDRIHFVCTHF